MTNIEVLISTIVNQRIIQQTNVSDGVSTTQNHRSDSASRIRSKRRSQGIVGWSHRFEKNPQKIYYLEKVPNAHPTALTDDNMPVAYLGSHNGGT